MQEKIMVSVIIISYNHEKYIKQAIKSVLEQDFPYSMEIIIGDDASTDKSSEIIEEYARQDQRIISICRKKNLGATKNIYDLYKRARGKYIAILEGDDYWCNPNKLKIQIEFLEEHPDFIATTHDIIDVDKNGSPISLKEVDEKFKGTVYTYNDFNNGFFPGQTASLVHRNFYLTKNKKYDIFETAHYLVGDTTIFLFLVELGSIYKFKEKFSCYRYIRDINMGNACSIMMRNNNSLEMYNYFDKLDDYCKKYTNSKITTKIYKKAYFLKSVYIFLHKPNFRNLSIFLQIFKKTDKKLEYLNFVFRRGMRKIKNAINN